MTDKNLRTFGHVVRRAREGQELSQEDLAEKAGLHRTYIGGIERGERNVGLVNILRICGALGISPADLFRRFGDALKRDNDKGHE